MRPRWKIVAELVLNVMFTLVGANMMVRGIKGELLFDVWPSWILIVVGAAMTWLFIDRVKERWSEL